MCDKFCRNSTVGFSNINSSSFNRFEQAMNYINNNGSQEQNLKASREMLAKQIARTFRSCPTYILEASSRARANHYLKEL